MRALENYYDGDRNDADRDDGDCYNRDDGDRDRRNLFEDC